MKRRYIKPECNFITLVGPLLQSQQSIEMTNKGEIDDMDDVNSKSYQGGSTSLLWEDND